MDQDEHMYSPAGGAAAKAGVLFEAYWTALHGFFPVIDGEFDCITLEPVGAEGVGIEFLLKSESGLSAVHQCKGGASSSWTLAELGSSGILKTLHGQVAGDPQRRAILGTAVNTKLQLLRDAACSQTARMTWAKTRRDELTRLACDLNVQEEDVLNFLQRLDLHTASFSYLEAILKIRLKDRATKGTVLQAVAALTHLSLAGVTTTLTAGQIKAELEQYGVRIDKDSSRQSSSDLETKRLGFAHGTARLLIQEPDIAALPAQMRQLLLDVGQTHDPVAAEAKLAEFIDAVMKRERKAYSDYKEADDRYYALKSNRIGSQVPPGSSAATERDRLNAEWDSASDALAVVKFLPASAKLDHSEAVV
jgi:hypothetical protein